MVKPTDVPYGAVLALVRVLGSAANEQTVLEYLAKAHGPGILSDPWYARLVRMVIAYHRHTEAERLAELVVAAYNDRV